MGREPYFSGRAREGGGGGVGNVNSVGITSRPFKRKKIKSTNKFKKLIIISARTVKNMLLAMQIQDMKYYMNSST
jgi:hypothetical protein